MRLRLLLTPLVSLAVLTPATPAAAEPSATCTVVGAPSGSDRAAGTTADPLRTAQAVIDRLGPGDTGCLRAGRYAETSHGNYVADFVRPGRRGARIVLRSFPGERATIAGFAMINRDASHVTVTKLDFDTTPRDPATRRMGFRSQIGIGILGADAVFSANRVENRHGTCLGLGGTGEWGAAVRPAVVGNRLGPCGTRGDKLEHGIYGNDVRGGRISGNLITGVAGFALHLRGSDRGMLIDHNVLAYNGGGVIFSGAGRAVPRRNLVTRNVITDSSRWPGITYWWGEGWQGSGNRATRNCLARNADDGDRSTPGYTMHGNVDADPAYRSATDLQIATSSPCRKLLGYDPVARLATL